MEFGATLYVRNSELAAKTYCEAFGMTVGYHALRDDGTYLHAELEKDGCGFAVSESGDAEAARAVLEARQPVTSLGLSLESDEALRRAYRVLSEGGRVLRELGPLPWSPLSADLVDRFGVCWYLYVSQHRPD